MPVRIDAVRFARRGPHAQALHQFHGVDRRMGVVVVVEIDVDLPRFARGRLVAGDALRIRRFLAIGPGATCLPEFIPKARWMFPQG